MVAILLLRILFYQNPVLFQKWLTFFIALFGFTLIIPHTDTDLEYESEMSQAKINSIGNSNKLMGMSVCL